MDCATQNLFQRVLSHCTIEVVMLDLFVFLLYLAKHHTQKQVNINVTSMHTSVYITQLQTTHTHATTTHH